MTCPMCDSEDLIYLGKLGSMHCYRCRDCGEELERLAACGATNWWCNRCNELKSKSRVKTEMVKV